MTGMVAVSTSSSTYRILRELGSRVAGTHAAVRGAHDLVVVQRFKRSSPEATDTIQVEARCLIKNWHPNVARVRHVEVVDEELFIATELIDGVTLVELLAAETSGAKEALPPPVVVRIVLDVLAGLQNIHGMRDTSNALLGAFHGAVCPANIVVGKDGVARLVAAFRPRPVTVDSRSESLCYASPEVAEERGTAHPGSDLYACGVILWEALQGKRLFDETQPSQIVQRQREAEIPWAADPGSIRARLGPVVLKAIAFEPALRFRTAGELAGALRQAAGSEIAPGSRVAQTVVERFGDRIRARRAELDPRPKDARQSGPAPALSAPSPSKLSLPTPLADFPVPANLTSPAPLPAKPAPRLDKHPTPVEIERTIPIATSSTNDAPRKPAPPPRPLATAPKPTPPTAAPALAPEPTPAPKPALELALTPTLPLALPLPPVPEPEPVPVLALPEPEHEPVSTADPEPDAEPAPEPARLSPSTSAHVVTVDVSSNAETTDSYEPVVVPMLKRGIPLRRALAIVAAAIVITLLGIVVFATTRDGRGPSAAASHGLPDPKGAPPASTETRGATTASPAASEPPRVLPSSGEASARPSPAQSAIVAPPPAETVAAPAPVPEPATTAPPPAPAAPTAPVAPAASTAAPRRSKRPYEPMGI